MKKNKAADVIFKAFIITVLAIYSLGILYLLLWGLQTSFKSRLDFLYNGNVVGLPSWEYSKDEILFGNYKLAFELFEVPASVIFYSGNTLVKHQTNSNLLTMTFNTIVYAGLSCVLTTMVCYTVAYLCSKYKFKFSKFVYVFALFMMSVPTVGTYPAQITLLRSIGVFDTYFCHVLQKFTFGGMYFFVFHAFFESMSDAYSEAAEIDGASQFRIYFSIIVPLGMKMISTVMLIHLVEYWNDYQAPLLYTPTLPTISYGVYHLCNVAGNAKLKTTPGMVTCCMLLAVPILVVFVAFKEKLMGNISMGGEKG